MISCIHIKGSWHFHIPLRMCLKLERNYAWNNWAQAAGYISTGPEIWFGSRLRRSRRPSHNGTILLAVIFRVSYQPHHRALDKNRIANEADDGRETIWCLVICGKEGRGRALAIIYFCGSYPEGGTQTCCEQLCTGSKTSWCFSGSRSDPG